MSSRLFQEIREKRGLVYSIYSSGDFFSDSGIFYVYAGTGHKEVKELIPDRQIINLGLPIIAIKIS